MTPTSCWCAVFTPTSHRCEKTPPVACQSASRGAWASCVSRTRARPPPPPPARRRAAGPHGRWERSGGKGQLSWVLSGLLESLASLALEKEDPSSAKIQVESVAVEDTHWPRSLISSAQVRLRTRCPLRQLSCPPSPCLSAWPLPRALQSRRGEVVLPFESRHMIMPVPPLLCSVDSWLRRAV